jgi:hypothetical protein
VHVRLAPGFVLTCTLEDDVRMVTFANGTTAREVRVTCDDAERRFVYCVESERVRHYNAALIVRAISDGAVAVMQPALDRA